MEFLFTIYLNVALVFLGVLGITVYWWYSLFTLFSLFLATISYFLEKDWQKTSWIFSLSQILMWSSLWLSDWFGWQSTFPLKSMVYKMAGDTPPSSVLPIFCLNFLIWFLVSWGMVKIIPFKKFKNKIWRKITFISAVLIMLNGIGHLMLIFD